MSDFGRSDLELAARMLEGDEDSFEEFFQTYFPRLYRFALARVGRDADVAEDIVQAALSRAVVALKTYRGEAALFTWLCTFCRHEISEHYRRHRQAGEPVELLEDSPEIRAALESLAGAGGGAEDQLRSKEIARLVQVALDALPSAYGDALEWKYIHGLPVKEIAQRLKLGTKAAESLLTRARQAFREGFVTLTGSRWSLDSPDR